MKHLWHILVSLSLLSVGVQAADTNKQDTAARGGADNSAAVASKCDQDPQMTRSSQERKACRQREAKRKSVGAGASGGKDESFDSATSGRPDPDSASRRRE